MSGKNKIIIGVICYDITDFLDWLEDNMLYSTFSGINSALPNRYSNNFLTCHRILKYTDTHSYMYHKIYVTDLAKIKLDYKTMLKQLEYKIIE